MISGKVDDIDDVIPESILSLAKDARYISQCQILLQQAFNAFLVVREQQQGVLSSSSLGINGSGEGGEQKQREILMRIRKQTTWYISFILYIYLVVIPTGKTLGMEACGLTFSNNDVVTTNQTQPATTSTTATAITTRRNCSILAGASLFLAAAGGLIREYYSAASIHTSSGITNNNDNNDENGRSDDNQQHQQTQQERLRGRERNMMHERLRRQMLERAKSASASVLANSSCDGIVVDDEGRKDKDQDLTLSHGDDITAKRVKQTSSLSSSSSTSLSSSSKRLLSIIQQLSKVSCYRRQ